MRYLHDYTEGERLIAFCLIKSREVAVASNQREYMNLEVGDRSGSLQAKLWDVTEELKAMLQVKSIVKVDALVQSYKGKKQLVIQRVRLAVPDDQVAMETLIPASERSFEELWERLQSYIGAIKSGTLRAIVQHILAYDTCAERLRCYPAGVKMHHNYYHGLLEHIVSLLTLAEQLIPLYPQIEQDVLYATCILHDIGKLDELSDPLAPDYTTPGQLIGHLVMGVERLNEACRQLSISAEESEVLHLKHCILSHHGDVENGWGSAVSGKTPTAVLFHYLDQIDSKMNALQQVINGAQDEEEWVYAPALRRRVWRGY
ncbi:HD domain-containing protein [Brevibacillus humidisoli]|uniref:3'-5' exoribonuclease YhaM family protein n=1 Tax=Brevibacillus humidisoli TaxID=2895522 RepID=UPI001E6484CC|nr:OB-fold nucleic acid binding domain-containing protein [Brevibacillus humidisoli]UFJ41641.1 HD domain-containing protein [Brevibacillus humidisoli]